MDNLKKDLSRFKTVRDEQMKSLGVFSSTRNMIKEKWHYNSGYSQYMMGNNCFLVDLQPSNYDWVIFGDSEKERIMGIGYLII